MTPEQLEKRKRIMRRSMALGHCVCNPRKPCPCDTFKEFHVCECAGERMASPAGEIRLTQTVRKTGCSSKISKKDLKEALADLPDIDDPRVLVGRAAGDDAGVIRLSGETATVLTVDVFAPSVDDPYTFGQIAAANSVSDIYAMGARPQVALSIIGFPIDTLPVGIMHEILRGGIDKMKEAGATVIGGHSINDEEVKFGFAVVGHAPPDGIVTNAGAEAGDAVVLTKPLGVGIISFANQVGRAPEGSMEAVAESMAALNGFASERMVAHGAHAATDVTGFGLVCHMAEIVKNSGLEVEIDFDRVPVFDGVAELARGEVLPGAVERNRESIDESMFDFSALAPAQEAMLFCPETSGGLLVFLPESKAQELVDELHEGGARASSIIGRVTGKREGGLIKATTSRAKDFTPIEIERAAAGATAGPHTAPLGDDYECCPDGPPDTEDEAPPSRTVRAQQDHRAAPGASASDAYKAYMAAVNAAGAISAKNKALMALALSILSRCEPCVKLKTKAAREAGASEEEMAEAVALGISFGGAPVGMFYNAVRGGVRDPGAG